MTNNKDNILILLNSRAYIYEMFFLIFGNDPDIELLNVLTADTTQQFLELYTDDSYPGYTEAFSKFFGAITTLQDEVAPIDLLQREYMRLLSGPHKLVAPPWESVYQGDGRLLFQKSTLDVRAFYAANDMLVAQYPNVADDHIALEMAFMSRLAKRAISSCENNEYSQMQTHLTSSASFLEKHLLEWVPKYLVALDKCDATIFYPVATNILLEFMRLDKLHIPHLAETTI